MPDYYCGMSDVPKGKRRGTLKECLESKQVRYHGIVAHALDDILSNKKTVKRQPTVKQLESRIDKKFVKLKNLEYKVKNIEAKYKKEKDENKKEKLKEKHDIEYEKWAQTNDEFKELQKMLNKIS